MSPKLPFKARIAAVAVAIALGGPMAVMAASSHPAQADTWTAPGHHAVLADTWTRAAHAPAPGDTWT